MESYKKDKEGRPLRDPQKVFDSYVGGLKWENVDLDKGSRIWIKNIHLDDEHTLKTMHADLDKDHVSG